MNNNNFSSSTEEKTATSYSIQSAYQPWFNLFNAQSFEAVPSSISGYFESQIPTYESISTTNINSINNTFTQLIPMISFSHPWMLAPASLVTQVFSFLCFSNMLLTIIQF